MYSPIPIRWFFDTDCSECNSTALDDRIMEACPHLCAAEIAEGRFTTGLYIQRSICISPSRYTWPYRSLVWFILSARQTVLRHGNALVECERSGGKTKVGYDTHGFCSWYGVGMPLSRTFWACFVHLTDEHSEAREEVTDAVSLAFYVL